MTALAAILAGRIRAEGPMTLADYMQTCLLHPDHGYYATHDPFGQAGDFVTAPEIHQMFGELCGLALAQAWLDQGCPAPFTLAEIGPGRGTLMADALRAIRVVPGMAEAAQVTLIEVSPHLRQVQRDRLAQVLHLDRAEDLPDQPLFLIANEFFDALPIRQFRHNGQAWAETMVALDGGRLAFALSPPVPLARAGRAGDVHEICSAAPGIVAAIAGRIAAHGGAAILIDYGNWDGQGDTFQALRHHAPVDPLAEPGLADLTAHVDFAPLARSARSVGAQVSAMETQGDWLRALGAGQRAARLAAAGDAGADAALKRLTDPAEMGQLFKVLAIWPQGAPPVPGTKVLDEDADNA
ncbi:MAG: SAM-dependent methyltransferase [Paracoccus sp. (in: a-proteobacteria)]|uniref:class I SAM-dependent methyltransferase n=1 Tax=Paracoccus sp. TaxID=267 RepID=UPI0026DF8918|nr:SAM-dependent methyltransferase [Paracoccus sp. (in: a-proteobacteria)]MDO5632958.1 SAM-dependent methyltransferase [Paracoccus sp. (in: a-proteobacteria)]